MPRIAFMGAGSTIFAKSVLGDCILTPEIKDLEIALHDIDPVRLKDSKMMLENLAKNVEREVKIEAYLDRREALKGAKYIVNAIQVGGYDPCTITDFEIPKNMDFVRLLPIRLVLEEYFVLFVQFQYWKILQKI